MKTLKNKLDDYVDSDLKHLIRDVVKEAKQVKFFPNFNLNQMILETCLSCGTDEALELSSRSRCRNCEWSERFKV